MKLAKYLGDGEYNYRKEGLKVGIEVELEGVQPTDFGQGWVIHNDGSLRGVSFEAVMAQPTSLPASIELVNKLNDVILKSKPSMRTSVHVHVDVRPLTLAQIMSVILVYSMLEDAFFAAHPDRYGNPFCLSVPQSAIAVNIKRMTRHIPVRSTDNLWQEIHGVPFERVKYGALNVGHLKDFGSLEFRHHGSAVSADDVNRWARVCHDFVVRAAECDPEKVLDCSEELIGILKDTMADILPTHVVDYLTAIINVKSVRG